LISNKQIVESPSSGNDRISPNKFLANTVLPAPINVIFLDEWLIGFLCGPKGLVVWTFEEGHLGELCPKGADTA
jgi:hypothetical protein